MSSIINFGSQRVQPAHTSINYAETFITQSPSTVQTMATSLWKVYSFFMEYTQKQTPKVIDYAHPYTYESDSEGHELSILADAMLHRRSISQDARWIEEGEEPEDGRMYVPTDVSQRKMSAY